ncbi:hypothetical protein D5278_00930 [bacterium 1XD21-13]|nr:hypothetical protein [bacterium 1XD21-13]
MNILAIGCHPDDLEIGCGGTLARYAKQGHTVIMCHIANGDMGHVEIMPEELNKIRTKEAEDAGKILGAKEVISLNVSDLYLNHYDDKIRQELTRVIRYTKPAFIISHSPDDYMQDHREAGAFAFDVSFGSSVTHYASSSEAYDGIVPIYYMDTLAGINFIPSLYVDISETIEIKLKALSCHESQIKWLKEHDHIDFLDFVKTCSKYRGLQSNCAFAEGFRQCLTWPRIRSTELPPFQSI